MNYSFVKVGVIGFIKIIVKEWGFVFGVRVNIIVFGYIFIRFIVVKEKGGFVIGFDGEKIVLGIFGK